MCTHTFIWIFFLKQLLMTAVFPKTVAHVIMPSEDSTTTQHRTNAFRSCMVAVEGTQTTLHCQRIASTHVVRLRPNLFPHHLMDLSFPFNSDFFPALMSFVCSLVTILSIVQWTPTSSNHDNFVSSVHRFVSNCVTAAPVFMTPSSKSQS